MGVRVQGGQVPKLEHFSASRKNSECKKQCMEKGQSPYIQPAPNLSDKLLSKLLSVL